MNSYLHFYFVTRDKSSRINGRGIGILPIGYWLEANATSQLSGVVSRKLDAVFLFRFAARAFAVDAAENLSASTPCRVEITPESDTFPSEAIMEIPKRLIDCLNENKATYEILRHPEAVTAQRIAQAEHVKGRHHAKVVIIKSGEQHLMVALQADHQIDLEKVEKATSKACSLDKEQEFKSLFADCAIGAMPPFGNLYGLPTYVDKHLAEQDYIVFEAGTHTDAIKMSYRDYDKIVKPKVEDLAIKLQLMKGA
jgi:Ala-tRNA(Pro) deacylase